MESTSSLDCIIVGAGASGLAAAGELSSRGARILVLEARRRLGGRVWTMKRDSYPVELGAEFVHGQPESSFGVIRSAGLRAVELVDAEPNPRGRDDFFYQIDRVLNRLDVRAPDRPFAEFARRLPPSLSQAGRMASSYVQSFHAADLGLISCRDLAEQQKSADEERDSFRLIDGYDGLIGALARTVPPSRIRLGAVVENVDWKGPRVRVRSGGRAFSAKTALITLPLGVLKSSAASFSPGLPARKRRALSLLHMGAAMRVVFVFKARSWEKIRARLPEPSFFQSTGGRFAVFWTRHPLRSPLITAWAGGPPAAELCARGKDVVQDMARRDLAHALRMPAARLSDALESCHFHDWQADPFSRGAYTYLGAGGANARRDLAAPEAGRLFFGGEAADLEGQSATVAGAISSGRRAAKQVLATLRR